MSDPRAAAAEHIGRVRARVIAAVPHRARDLGHGKVFAIGIAAAVAVGSTFVGLTWAGSDKTQTPVVRSSPVPSTVPGQCSILVGDRPLIMDVDRARTITMVAGVATQVDAVPAQAARALDVALSGQPHYLPTVNQTLQLLARDDTKAPSAESLAVLDALTRPAALSCNFKVVHPKAEKKGKNGLIPRAEKVRSGVFDAFGRLKATGFGDTAAKDDGLEKAGRALEVWVKDGKKVDRQTGWVMANWLVARGASYRLNTVTFDSHSWKPSTGWRAQPQASPAANPAPADTSVAKAAKKAAAQAEAARQRESVLIVVDKGR